MLRPVSSPLNVPGLAAADVALGDLLALYDDSAAGLRQLAIERLLGFALPHSRQVRLTLTDGTPITTSDVVGASTIHLEPFRGRWVALFDGTRWKLHDLSAGASKALSSLTNDRPHDVYLFDDSGMPTLEFVAWTNDSTRATALTVQDGVLVKSGDATRRYLGSFHTTSTSTTEDSARNRYLVNWANAVPRPLFTCPAYNDNNANTTYSATSTTFAEWNGGTNSRVNWLIPVNGLPADVALHAVASAPSGQAMVCGLGWDSTTSVKVAAHVGPLGTALSDVGGRFGEAQAAGRHFACGMAFVTAGTGTLLADHSRFGATADLYATYLQGWILG